MAQEYSRDLIKEIRDLLSRLLSNATSPTSGDATAANQALEIAELTAINSNTTDVATETTLSSLETFVTTLDKNTGAVTPETLRVVLEANNNAEITAISNNVATTRSYTAFDTWDKIPGQSKVFTWVTGPGGGQVVDNIEYYIGITLTMTQTFTYDGNDNVLTITAS
jgi:hypothetical protein